MATAYTLIAQRCGLSQREAAELLGVRIDTVKSWSSGRNRAPDGVIKELRQLYGRIEQAAIEGIKVIHRIQNAHGAPDEITLGIASDDAEAQTLGWPCVGAHAAVLGLMAARTSLTVRVVPRGSEPYTAAAADAHGR